GEAGPARDLVEGFARRVVPGPRDRNDSAFLDAHELRVAYGDDEPMERILDRARGISARAELRREEVPLEVVDTDEGDAPGECESLSGGESHEQGSDQPG